jgi:signal transduction histidine kinase
VTHPGFGLVSMRQRAQSVGGELRISSVPGQGSDVQASL